MVNVSQVRQLSPFRYPGGKSWLVPEIRRWLALRPRPAVFVEPFAGGAMVGLSVAAERLANHVVLTELDDGVAAVWQVIFGKSDAYADRLCKWILNFSVTYDNVCSVLAGTPTGTVDYAFRTIVRNRMQHGGIMAAGAGLMKSGESGRGLLSRWYPATLCRRIAALRTIRDRVSFIHGDGFDTISNYADDASACFFVDPPYSLGQKSPGTRLYTHSDIDHGHLFHLMGSVRGAAVLTYNDTPMVRQLSRSNGFRVTTVPMKSTHHVVVRELMLLKDALAQADGKDAA
jgi:DNA adenine methylase